MSINMMKKFFNEKNYERGYLYYREGRVVFSPNGEKFVLVEQYDHQIVNAMVQGEKLYLVQFPIQDGMITQNSYIHASCSCPHFKGEGRNQECKHIVAAMFEFLEAKSKTEPSSVFLPSPSVGKSLISKYNKNIAFQEEVGQIQLIPQFYDLEGEYPYISLLVGKEKKYVVKNISNFLDAIYAGEVVKYGKELEFKHELSMFTPESRQLIQVLNNQNDQRYEYNSFSEGTQFCHGKRSVAMDGNSFQLFFQLFFGKEVESQHIKGAKYLFENGNPSLTLLIQKAKKGAVLRIDVEQSMYFYGNHFALYALVDNLFMKCSSDFAVKVSPLLDYLQRDIVMNEEELVAFCGSVLPQVKDYIVIEDEELLCESFSPDVCTICYYFDYESTVGVVAKLRFRYGDEEIEWDATEEQRSGIRQNAQQEELGIYKLEKYFRYEKITQQYELEEEEDHFLTTDLPSFHQLGEVFLSNSLRGKFIEPKKQASLGISVSDGILTLELDTGEFPPEELQELYHSFLKKKTYHKLKDGRLFQMENSGFEKLAEITHMLQLTDSDLKEGKVNLPAYRSLYLDSVLEGCEEVQAQRNQDFRHMMKDFKSLSDSDYQPPDTLQTKMRPYQILGFQWLKTLEQYRFGGILADEMGLGKTLQVITYLLSINRQKVKEPSLVLCPASLILNWKDEFEKFAPSLKVMVILGTASQRREQIQQKESEEMDVWVSSYDLLKRDRELYQEKEFYTCVLDEAQSIKNQSTLISKTVKELRCKQRFALTGTPIENRLSELWNLFDFLMPQYLFSHGTFVKKLEKPIIQSGDSRATQQLSLLVQPFLMRRLKKDVLKELPDKIEHVRKIYLSENERKTYQAAVKQVREKASALENKLQILALLTQLRQICCDPNLCYENYQGETSKLDACIELCQAMAENGHKILLFSQFTSMLDRIRCRLDEENISHLTIQGSTPKEKRAKYVKEFQEGKASVFLISLKAGGTGLNLTEADVVIHYDPWWNQAAQNQATDRAHRIGQKKHVQVYKLIAEGTIEEKILELQEKKASLMEMVTGEAGQETLSKEDIMQLLEEI